MISRAQRRACLSHCFNAFLKNLKFNRLGLMAARWNWEIVADVRDKCQRPNGNDFGPLSSPWSGVNVTKTFQGA